MPKSAHELIKQAVEDWPEFEKQDDTPVDRDVLVEWFAGFFDEAKEYLAREAASPYSPSYRPPHEREAARQRGEKS